MAKKRRSMLLYVTATSVVGLACNDQRHAVGDVAQSPDIRVGKVAMVAPDAALEPIPEDASVTAKATPSAAPSSASSAAPSSVPSAAPHPRPHAPGKIAPPPDK
jgi:hypothetical protein